jgi:hypothetical protein
MYAATKPQGGGGGDVRTDGQELKWYGIARRHGAWMRLMQKDNSQDEQSYPSLTPVAVRLLSQHATSAAV